MRKRFFGCVSLLVLAIFVMAGARPAAAQMCGSGVCVKTWQPDNGTDVCTGCAYRTGQNLNEATITYSTIKTDTFGEICSANLDGPVYAQPLVVTGVKFNNGSAQTVVYVVTENDSVTPSTRVATRSAAPAFF
jgi:hypothetical protein